MQPKSTHCSVHVTYETYCMLHWWPNDPSKSVTTHASVDKMIINNNCKHCKMGRRRASGFTLCTILNIRKTPHENNKLETKLHITNCCRIQIKAKTNREKKKEKSRMWKSPQRIRSNRWILNWFFTGHVDSSNAIDRRNEEKQIFWAILSINRGKTW